MKSNALNMPSHVAVRQKKKADGSTATYFYFTVKKAKQEEWRKTRRLPLAENERTALADAAELAAVFRDAATLTARYKRETKGLSGPAPGSIPWLIARFDEQVHQSERAASLYKTCATKLMAWSNSNRHPTVDRLSKPVIRDYLATMSDTPYMRDQVRGYLKRLLDIACDHEIIERNPCTGISFNDHKQAATRANTGPWTLEQVEQRVQLCMEANRPSIALAILIGFETGQRPENIDQFRHGSHYDAEGGAFRFNQTKTGQYVAIPVSQRLRRWIERFGGDDYLLVSERHNRPFTRDSIQAAFGQLQRKAGVEVLKRRYLRHTCVCNLADAGCDVPQIASVTGHTLTSANEILKHYWRPTETQAAEAMRRREQYENSGQALNLSVDAWEEQSANLGETMGETRRKLFDVSTPKNRTNHLKQIK